MASIRMPKNGRLFYKFCRASRQADERFVMFPRWVEMIVSAAAVGCHHADPDCDPELVEADPYPVPLETFQNQKLFEYILMMGITRDKDPAVVDDEDRLCRIIEEYASSGFRHMREIYDECGGDHHWIRAWQDMVFDAEKGDD